MTIRGSHSNRRSQARAREKQRMGYVIAIAHVGETNVLQVAKTLLQGEVVSQRLTGMLQIAEPIDDWNRGMLCHVFNCFLREGSQYDHIHPALKILCNVAEFLARVDAAGGLVHKVT